MVVLIVESDNISEEQLILKWSDEEQERSEKNICNRVDTTCMKLLFKTCIFQYDMKG